MLGNREIRGEGRAPQPGGAGMVERWRRRAALLEQERREAATLFRKLEASPESRRDMMLRNGRRFHSWALCEHILARCARRGAVADPGEIDRLARLARQIAEHLDPAVHGRAPLMDLKARAAITRAAVLRLTGDHAAAEGCLEEAAQFLDQGSGDPLELAALLRQRALLLNDQRRCPQATVVMDRAIQIYRRVGEPRLLGRSLLQKADLCVDRRHAEELRREARILLS